MSTLDKTEFSKNNIVDFIKLYLPLVPGESIGNRQTYADAYSKLSFENLHISASVGKGRATGIPWISFQGYGQETKKGIYPALLFYKRLNIAIVAYGVSAKDKPNINWSLGDNQEAVTIKDFFQIKHKIVEGYETKYNDSLVYSAFEIPVINGELDEANFKADEIMKALKVVCDQFHKQFSKNNLVAEEPKAEHAQTKKTELFKVGGIIESIKESGLIYDDKLIKRFACSLLTKPFVILSGLAGSGKTQLALAFAKCLSENAGEQICTVPVGADWTNSEPLLGYPNALKSDDYVLPESGALQLMIRANTNANKPYFLILDEMNLSVVERYFAGFLSAMESKERIKLWNGDSYVPKEIGLPKNLFIIGTINVDETTYMFSPKVLDRANVIEFKISPSEMEGFLTNMSPVDCTKLIGACSGMGDDFVAKAKEASAAAKDEAVINTLTMFFKELKRVNAEFGYRTVSEIYRYVTMAKDEDVLGLDGAIDTAILQKLLPKLHGSRKKLERTLSALWGLCYKNSAVEIGNVDSIEDELDKDNMKYPESADKIYRMYCAVMDNGFTSFAEA